MKHLIAAAVLMCGSALPALAQDVGTGATLYHRHCATCHGTEARGDGPMRPALLLQPSNLRK
ncbi:MAG: cytochrome c, partial [Tateyamaria sp.]